MVKYSNHTSLSNPLLAFSLVMIPRCHVFYLIHHKKWQKNHMALGINVSYAIVIPNNLRLPVIVGNLGGEEMKKKGIRFWQTSPLCPLRKNLLSEEDLSLINMHFQHSDQQLLYQLMLYNLVVSATSWYFISGIMWYVNRMSMNNRSSCFSAQSPISGSLPNPNTHTIPLRQNFHSNHIRLSFLQATAAKSKAT